MNTIFSTNRLLFRQLTVDDAPNVFELNSNALVMKYTGQPPMQSIDEAVNFLTHYSDYKAYGYGRWACILKDTNEFIGVFGLRFLPNENHVDIGGLFKPAYWNKGYAKEAAEACISYGFDILQINKIHGKCAEANTPSIKIMESVGMVYQNDYVKNGTRVLCYTIYK